MKRVLLLIGMSVLFSTAIFAQQPATDSLQQWRQKRTALSRHIDSLTILAMGRNFELQYLEEQGHNAQAALNEEASRGMLKHNADKARMDSLNLQIILLSEIKNGVHGEFDNFLIQLDSCIGVRTELEARIKATKKNRPESGR